jgi:nitroreductase
MEFYEVLRRRRSIRAYAQEAVPEATLKLLFEAVSLAPSACNNQPVRFLFVTDLAVRRRLCECYPRDWLAGAPVLVVALGNRETAWRRFNGQSAHVIDAAIAMEHRCWPPRPKAWAPAGSALLIRIRRVRPCASRTAGKWWP